MVANLLVYRRVIKGYFLSIARFICDLLPTGPPKDPHFYSFLMVKNLAFLGGPNLNLYLSWFGGLMLVSHMRASILGLVHVYMPNFGEKHIFPPRLGLPADCEETFQVVSSVEKRMESLCQ